APAGRRRWVIPVAAAAAVVAVIAGVVVATRGGGEPKVNTNAGSSGSNSATGTSSSAAAAAVRVGPSGRGVRIDSITIKDGKYSVAYRTAGYTAKVDAGDPQSHHIHFFFDDVPQEDAGTNGPHQTGAWILYDVPSPFEGYKVSDKPATARQMCALVANFLHEVELDTGNCVALPTG
ncbi:MAG: hypothetical protein QOH79_2520, partial [Acidimicrobiaceae bacterium]